MKRLIITLAFLLSAGLVFAGGGDYEIQPQEQRSWPQRMVQSEYKWTVQDYCSVAGVVVTAVGVVGGFYLNSRKKKRRVK